MYLYQKHTAYYYCRIFVNDNDWAYIKYIYYIYFYILIYKRYNNAKFIQSLTFKNTKTIHLNHIGMRIRQNEYCSLYLKKILCIIIMQNAYCIFTDWLQIIGCPKAKTLLFRMLIFHTFYILNAVSSLTLLF